MLAKVAGRKDPNRRKEPGEPGERQGTRALAGLGPVPQSVCRAGRAALGVAKAVLAAAKVRGQVLGNPRLAEARATVNATPNRAASGTSCAHAGLQLCSSKAVGERSRVARAVAAVAFVSGCHCDIHFLLLERWCLVGRGTARRGACRGHLRLSYLVVVVGILTKRVLQSHTSSHVASGSDPLRRLRDDLWQALRVGAPVWLDPAGAQERVLQVVRQDDPIPAELAQGMEPLMRRKPFRVPRLRRRLLEQIARQTGPRLASRRRLTRFTARRPPNPFEDRPGPCTESTRLRSRRRKTLLRSPASGARPS